MNHNIYRLTGLRILNTRPLARGKLLSQAIRAAGGIAIELPGLAIEATSDHWLHDLPDLHSVQQAIFTSTNAVNYFFATLTQKQLTWPTAIVVIAVGKATAAALADNNIRVDHLPSIADSEHLLTLDVLTRVSNQTIVLIKGIAGRALIADTLGGRGANLYCVDVYRRISTTIPASYSNSLWQNDEVDIILFSSQQAMHTVFNQFCTQGKDWLRGKPCFVLSKRLADEAKSLGIKTIFISEYDGLLNAFHQYNQGLIYDN